MSSNTRPKLTLGGRTAPTQSRPARQRTAIIAPSGSSRVQDIMQTVSGTLQLDEDQMQDAEAFARKLLS